MVVIEHNIDLVAAADCVVDLGPEGGEGGGEVVAWGTPEEVARVQRSRTAEFLRPALGRTRAGGSPSGAGGNGQRGVGGSGASPLGERPARLRAG